MIRKPQLSPSTAQRAITVSLGVSSLVGWSLLAFSAQSSAEVERQLRAQVASLQETQMQLLSERAHIQASLSDVAQLQAQLAAAQSELARLTPSRDQAQAEHPPAGTGAAGQTSHSEEALGVSETGSIKPKATTSRKTRGVRPPTETVSGHARDGKGLATTSGLDTARLRRLTDSAETRTP